MVFCVGPTRNSTVPMMSRERCRRLWRFRADSAGVRSPPAARWTGSHGSGEGGGRTPDGVSLQSACHPARGAHFSGWRCAVVRDLVDRPIQPLLPRSAPSPAAPPSVRPAPSPAASRSKGFSCPAGRDEHILIRRARKSVFGRLEMVGAGGLT